MYVCMYVICMYVCVCVCVCVWMYMWGLVAKLFGSLSLGTWVIGSKYTTCRTLTILLYLPPTHNRVSFS